MPGNNVYTSTICENEVLGGNPPEFSTTIPPLPYEQYFKSKFDVSENKWFYVEAPLEPGKIEHPLDKVVTYADCRKLEYPNYIDYIDGVVKGDEEQVAKYIQDCKNVKEKWMKTMEPITLREYYHQKLNLHIINNAP